MPGQPFIFSLTLALKLLSKICCEKYRSTFYSESFLLLLLLAYGYGEKLLRLSPLGSNTHESVTSPLSCGASICAGAQALRRIFKEM